MNTPEDAYREGSGVAPIKSEGSQRSLKVNSTVDKGTQVWDGGRRRSKCSPGKERYRGGAGSRRSPEPADMGTPSIRDF